MLSKEFQKKIYDVHKRIKDGYIKHGRYKYAIAYNATASIHTWIIRQEVDGKWHWLQPLDASIN
jgi:hypothetical protein